MDRPSVLQLADREAVATFEESPAIWSACLSATLLRNHGLDSLLAFQKRRALPFMSPVLTEKVNAVIRKRAEP